MTADQALADLVAIGYEDRVAGAFIEDKRLDLMKRQQNDAIRTVEIRFDSGLIGYNEAVVELDTLAIPAVKRGLILAKLEAEIASRIRLPSKTDLDKFATAEIIDRSEYRINLLRLGYPQIWAERFETMTYAVPPEEVPPPKQLTTAQVLNFFEDGLMSAEESEAALVAIGYENSIAESCVSARKLAIAQFAPEAEDAVDPAES